MGRRDSQDHDCFRRLTMQGNNVVFEEEHSHIEKEEREEDGVDGTRQRLLTESEDLAW